MKKTSKTHFSMIVLCLMSLLPATAWAHPEIAHATGFAAGFGHPMTGADHMLAMIAVGLWAAQMGGRAIWAVPGAFVGMMLVGGALGISGVYFPQIEEGIVISVLVLGILIAGAFRVPLFASAMLVGVFALFHGNAHGIEMPAAAAAVSYAAGFALATAMLHALGMAAGIAMQKVNTDRMTRFAGCAIALVGIYIAVA
jgi:urease accessory protein